jgi:diaminohydroxyphosphoribosylaminopyrimidine deaminase/5-amino-6-(5-phosphoribosylamino)uracil reductase
LFRRSHPSDIFLITTTKASETKKAFFEKKGVHVLVGPGKKGLLDLKWLFRELARREITSVLIEGGAHVIGSVLKQKLADKVYIYMAPVIMGDQKALSSVAGMKITNLNQAIRLTKITLRRIKEDLLLEGYLH